MNEGTSSGHLFWDDGNSIDTIGTGSYILVNFEGKQVSSFEYLVVLIVAGYFLTKKYENYFLMFFFYFLFFLLIKRFSNFCARRPPI